MAILFAACAGAETNNQKPAARSIEQIAAEALGDREGTILVIDPQSGRLEAAINPRLAAEQAYPPGSAIKPFTALAAMRAGLLRRETRRACSGRFRRDDFEIACSHPPSRSAFNLPQALAYSCNDYFAHAGERLPESAFHSTLTAFGFGARTGITAAGIGAEAPGRLHRGEWRAQVALGDTPDLLVTPAQLLRAYVALVAGGRLYRPQLAEAEGFKAQIDASLKIGREERAVLIEGMRGAIERGSAAPANLAQLPLYIFGKTGTSTSSNGYRTQGWFVGFAADGARPAPEDVRLGVLVFLKRAHGADGAQVARKIFEAYAAYAERESVAREETDRDAEGPRIKVRLAGQNAAQTRELSLEDYVAGVVAAEASTENEIEALKALASVARTYALHNRGRHKGEGYDFCSLTHCQRFNGEPPPERIRLAVRETEGVAFEDERGQAIEVYFHAACGGATTSPDELWGGASPSHLRSVRDDFCAASARRRWEDRIPAAKLAVALAKDPRTDTGGRLREIIVTERDASGRARMIALEGLQRRVVRGWDFKLVVGRALGWQLIKSSRFEVARAGDQFIFRGSGFGHGIGLCQEGAHVAARRGMGYRQILEHYFPGARLGGSVELERVAYHQRARRSFASEHFRVSVPAGTDERKAGAILRALEAARAQMERRLDAAGLRLGGGMVEVEVHATTADFIAETGQPGYAAGATSGGRIALQPVALLERRGVFMETLRHEYAHAVIEMIGGGRAPRWLAEGLAIDFAGEGRLLERGAKRERIGLDELERRLARPATEGEMRRLYLAAYLAVRELIRREGDAEVWRRVAGRE